MERAKGDYEIWIDVVTLRPGKNRLVQGKPALDADTPPIREAPNAKNIEAAVRAIRS